MAIGMPIFTMTRHHHPIREALLHLLRLYLQSVKYVFGVGENVDKQQVLLLLILLCQLIGETLGEVRPVADMHQRKAEMARHSDAFIALPGKRCLSPA